VSFVISNI